MSPSVSCSISVNIKLYSFTVLCLLLQGYTSVDGYSAICVVLYQFALCIAIFIQIYLHTTDCYVYLGMKFYVNVRRVGQFCCSSVGI